MTPRDELYETDAAVVLERALRQYDKPLSDERLCPEPRVAATRHARVRKAMLYMKGVRP